MRLFRLIFSISFLGIYLLFGLENSMDKEIVKIIQTYRTQGIKATQELLENLLTDKGFWVQALKNKDTDYGYYENIDFLFVANKSAPNLILYEVQEGNLKKINQTDALVGSGKGRKNVEGDLTTPIGVYDITSKLTGLSEYYGPLAFTTNYPNAYDKAQKKTGHGIWIHGFPLNGNREELNTKGCIAIENSIISQYDQLINKKKTILITYETMFKNSTKEELATILSGLYQWKEAWTRNDLEAYLSFYGKDFTRSDGMKFNAFKEYKKRVFDKKEQKTILFNGINISPYPNEESKNFFKISFTQDYSAYKNDKLTYASKSTKELYVELNGDKIEILTEK